VAYLSCGNCGTGKIDTGEATSARTEGRIERNLRTAILGYARMHCNEYPGALELFEIVLKELPDHAQALDCAAHCCFNVGQTDRGIALAKEALKRGAASTYRDWREGKYKKR
jgi:tetratricopeptide (TPR) repeat protein